MLESNPDQRYRCTGARLAPPVSDSRRPRGATHRQPGQKPFRLCVMKRVDLLLILALALPLPAPAACSGAGAGCCCTDAPPPAVGPSFAADCWCAEQTPARVAEPALVAPLSGWMSMLDWPGAGDPFSGGAGGMTADPAHPRALPAASAAPPTPLLALLCTLRL
jgi:hypothetical protein